MAETEGMAPLLLIFLVVFLSAMVIAYFLVALATVNLWRLVLRSEDGNDQDRPKRVVPGETFSRTRKRRCPEATHRLLTRSRRARCPHRRHH